MPGLARLLRRERAIRWQPVALGGFVLIAGALIAHFGLRYHSRLGDETLAVAGARYIALDFPSGLWDVEAFSRGPERLTAIVLLTINALVRPTASQFAVGHVVLALAWALVAVPTYLLARGLKLGATAALAIAALAVLNPWAVYGVTFLNTTLGYLTLTTLLYAMWRTTVRPSLVADLGVVLAFAFTVVARVGHTPFVLVLAPAILVQRWRRRPAGQQLRDWLRDLPGGVTREHPLLVAAVAAAVILLALKGERGLVGSYGTDILHQHVDLSVLWLRLREVTAHVAQGVAFIPLLFAVPWLAREIVRPRRAETGAFAVLVVAMLPVFLYVHLYAAVEDRYMAVLGPPILVAFGCALLRAEASWIAVGVVGALVARAVATVGIYPNDDPIGFFLAPAGQFFRRVVLNKLAIVLPFGDAHKLTIALVLIVAVAVLLAAGTRLPGRARTAVAVAGIGAVFAYTAVGAGYTMQKFTKFVGAAGLKFSQQTYVDRAADGQAVGVLIVNPVDDVTREFRWQDASYFNQSLAMTVKRGAVRGQLCCARHPKAPVGFGIDGQDGRVRVAAGVMPRLILVPTGWLPYGLNGTPLVTGHDLLRLERLPARAHTSFITRGGTYEDGWGKPRTTQRLRVFPSAAGGQGACLEGMISVPAPVSGRPVRVVMSGGADSVVRNARAGQIVPVRLRLADRHADEVRLSSGPSGILADGRRAGAQLADVHVVPCPRPGTGASSPQAGP